MITKNEKGQFKKGEYQGFGFLKGHLAWNKGKKTGIVPKTVFKKGNKTGTIALSEWRKNGGRVWNKGEKMIERTGENNFNWKGNEVSYSGIHKWIKKNLEEPGECVYCGREESLQWASISHKAKRDINDYIPLCGSCHQKYDRLARRGN